MKRIRESEQKILETICNDNDLPVELVTKLLRSAEKFSYENALLASRKREYQELIDFHFKTYKGER